jgi:hypothetical protein
MTQPGLKVWEGLAILDQTEQRVKAGTWVQPVQLKVAKLITPEVVYEVYDEVPIFHPIVKIDVDATMEKFDQLLSNLKGLKL